MRVALLLTLFAAPAPLVAGEALLVVFPDYPVDTDTFYGYTEQVGHAGVLLIDDGGLTKYYEFGRYDPEKKGRAVYRGRIPNAEISDGLATPASLKKVLSKISALGGKGGRIRAAYFLDVDFGKMNGFAKGWIARSTPGNPDYDPDRRAYSVTKFNCAHLAEDVILQGNCKIDEPTVIKPTPNNFVDEYIEEGNAEVLLDPATGAFSIGEGDEADAKDGDCPE